MERNGSGVSALLGLDGFVVRAQLLDEDTGEWWLAVETTEDRAWCPTCGVRAVGHGRRRVKVRDLPMADRPVVLVWAKRLWRCPEPACPMGTWSEESDEIAPRAVLTERARAEIARRVGLGEQSVARAAKNFGVGWHAAMAAVWDHGQPRVDHLTRLGAPAAVGLDETSFLAATATHPTLLVTGILDLDSGRLIDVLPARSARAVTDWLAVEAGTVAGRDPPCGDRPLPALRHRGRRRRCPTPAWWSTTSTSSVSPTPRWTRFAAGCSTPPWVTAATRAIRSTGSAAGSSPATNTSTPPASPGCWPGSTSVTPTAKWPPATWPRNCCARPTSPTMSSTPAGGSPCSTTTAPRASVPELERLARTIARWETPILRWHRTGLTNAATEGTNLIVKNIKRLGFGFRNFDNYRLRLLLRCGAPWQHHRVASIRPRHPRVSA